MVSDPIYAIYAIYASGAKSFRFQVYWINRGGLPAETTGFASDHVLSDLGVVVAQGRARVRA